MRKAIIGLMTIALLAPATAPAAESTTDGPEACLAANPAQPTCTVTMTADTGPFLPTGNEGYGDWIVVVKRGKKKFVMKSAAGVNGYSFAFKVGDVVTATANTPGSWVLVGHTT